MEGRTQGNRDLATDGSTTAHEALLGLASGSVTELAVHMPVVALVSCLWLEVHSGVGIVICWDVCRHGGLINSSMEEKSQQVVVVGQRETSRSGGQVTMKVSIGILLLLLARKAPDCGTIGMPASLFAPPPPPPAAPAPAPLFGCSFSPRVLQGKQRQRLRGLCDLILTALK